MGRKAPGAAGSVLVRGLQVTGVGSEAVASQAPEA